MLTLRDLTAIWKILGDVVDITGLNCNLSLNGISKKRIKVKGERIKEKGEREKDDGRGTKRS